MTILVKLNSEKNIIKLENPCTKTFLLLNKEEAFKLRNDLNELVEKLK